MNSEQRVEASEEAVANSPLSVITREELSKMMRDTAIEIIKVSCLPGGVLHSHVRKAAVIHAAEFKIYS